MKYRKKPVVIEAFRFGFDRPPLWWKTAVDAGVARCDGPCGDVATIKTLEGDHRAIHGDWIIQGIKGELYPCKADIFEATYQVVGSGTHPHA